MQRPLLASQQDTLTVVGIAVMAQVVVDDSARGPAQVVDAATCSSREREKGEGSEGAR